MFVFTAIERSFKGRNPPDEIKDIDKLKESKVLKSNILRIINIITVISAISKTLLDQKKITAQQAGEALVVVSKYLKGN